jgi:hypothetical protein
VNQQGKRPIILGSKQREKKIPDLYQEKRTLGKYLKTKKRKGKKKKYFNC